MELMEHNSMKNMEISKTEPVGTAGKRWSKTWPQHLAAALAALSIVGAGAAGAWIDPALQHLARPYSSNNVTVRVITYENMVWIVYLHPLGSLIGALPAGYLAYLLGRRSLILIMAVPMLVSWLMILLGGRSIALLYIARFVLGFTCGVVSVASPLYSDEIAEVRVRGAVGSYLDLMIVVGFLYVYIFYAILSYIGMAIACTLLPVLFAVTFYWMPESPLYLLTKGQADKADKSLRWLRGVGTGQSAEIEGELREMQSFINRPTDGESASTGRISIMSRVIYLFRSISVTSATLKAINIIFGLMAFHQFCEWIILLAYDNEVFLKVGSAWRPHTNWTVFRSVQFVSTLIAIFIVDRVGRKTLLIISGAGLTLFLLMFIIFMGLLEQGVEIQNISWLHVFAVYLYYAAVSVGIGPVPWFMIPELLSKEARVWVSSLAVCFNWTAAFLIRKYFDHMAFKWSIWSKNGLFLVVCIVGTIFVVVFVPETKKKTREEINTQLSNHWTFVTGWHKQGD